MSSKNGKMRYRFNCFSIDEKSSPIPIVELLDLSRIPEDRRGKELKGAVLLGHFLQIWGKKNIGLVFLNENKSQYKGIDFFLCDISNPEKYLAFQLVEHLRFNQEDMPFDKLGDWICDKKSKKGDEKIHLVVSVKTGNIELLKSELKETYSRISFASLTVFGLDENSNYSLFGIFNNQTFYAKIAEKNNVDSSMACPFFNENIS